VAQPRDEVRERHRGRAGHRVGGDDDAPEVARVEPVARRVEVGVLLAHDGAEGIEVGLEVPARAVGVDQRVDARDGGAPVGRRRGRS
jgi:hypothetical protein